MSFVLCSVQRLAPRGGIVTRCAAFTAQQQAAHCLRLGNEGVFAHRGRLLSRQVTAMADDLEIEEDYMDDLPELSDAFGGAAGDDGVVEQASKEGAAEPEKQGDPDDSGAGSKR